MVKRYFSSSTAIAWGSLFVFVVVVLWSALAVQVMSPLNREITKTGFHEDAGCARCQEAWQVVWQSFVSIVRIVFAGNAWGD